MAAVVSKGERRKPPLRLPLLALLAKLLPPSLLLHSTNTEEEEEEGRAGVESRCEVLEARERLGWWSKGGGGCCMVD